MQDNDEWMRKDKLFTRKANEDKNRYLEDMCLELERSGNDSRRVFKFLKKITHKRTALMDVINDNEGRALTQDDEIKKRWAEYYCQDLYKKPQDDNSDFHHTGNESEPPPLRDEIRQALDQLANGKSTGVDELPAELWKAIGELGIDLLWKLCKAIWEQQEWPTDWCRAVFLPIYKKWSKKECSNHITISLIVNASKVLLKIIVNRIKSKYSTEISEEQAGFVEGRGTREHIVNVRQIMERTQHTVTYLYTCALLTILRLLTVLIMDSYGTS